MKTKMKHLMAMVLMAAAIGMVACTEKEPAPTETPDNPPVQNDGKYALHYQDRTLDPGQTVYYAATEEDITDNFLELTFYIENLTSTTLNTSQSLVQTDGPTDFPAPELCAGGNCPWNGQPYAVAPGMYENAIFVHLAPAGFSGQTMKYTLTVGEGPALSNPTVAYLVVTI